MMERQCADKDHLEAEIAQLEQQIQQEEHINKCLKDWRYRNDAGFCRRYDDIGPDVDKDGEWERAAFTEECLKHQLKVIQQFSGITFTHAVCEVVRQDGLTIDCRRLIEGTCGDIQFEIIMSTSENLENVKDSHITDVTLAASDDITNDLPETIARLTQAKDIQGFLKLVQSYRTWIDARTKTFHHFTSTFPDRVSNDGVDTLCIACGNCELVASWQQKVLADSLLVPDIRLNMKLPPSVEKRQRKLLESMEKKFSLMLKELGIEKTINCLVSLAT